jgi:hypothetical protein
VARRFSVVVESALCASLLPSSTRINFADTGIPGRVGIPFCERGGGIPRTLGACNNHSSCHQLTMVDQLPANEPLDPLHAEMDVYVCYPIRNSYIKFSSSSFAFLARSAYFLNM